MNTSRARALLVPALAYAALPVVALVIGVRLVAGAALPWPIHPAQLAASGGTGFLLEVAAAILIAPMCGASRIPAARASLWLAVLVTASLAVLIPSMGTAPEILTRLAVGHIAMAAAVTLCFAIGRLMAAMLTNPLDAAGAAVLISLILNFAALGVGPNTATLDTSTVNALLATSPLISAAVAADIDLFHTPALYQISPIAHQQYAYQPWWATTLSYLGLALLILWPTTARMKGSR